jgi:glycosyltransferase involved in cell wall biosynthesis
VQPVLTKKLISIVTPCFNEDDNLEEIYRKTHEVMAGLTAYNYEHIFIDNASTDRSPEILRQLAAADPRVKVIFNVRNFGHIRSPYYGMLQARGDAVVSLVADFQDPPELIRTFVERWAAGYKVVVGVKEHSDEPAIMFAVRRTYYRALNRIANVDLIQNFTGFGLYDRAFVEVLRSLESPYPYFRGLIAEIGFPAARVPYHQPKRIRGITKNNLYTLYDMAMLGMTSHSKVPLRLATMIGFAFSTISLLISLCYLVLKFIYWEQFTLGTAPLLIGIFFFASVQLFFIGIIGEYIGAIHTQVMRQPLVVEKERVNFSEQSEQQTALRQEDGSAN